jgi:hypothetical protein
MHRKLLSGHPSYRSHCRHRHRPHDFRFPDQMGLHRLWWRTLRHPACLLCRLNHRRDVLPRPIFPFPARVRRCGDLLDLHCLRHSDDDGRQPQILDQPGGIRLRLIESLHGELAAGCLRLLLTLSPFQDIIQLFLYMLRILQYLNQD